MSQSATEGWLVRADTGGTFTDGWARDPGGVEHRCKLLSSGRLRAVCEEIAPDGRLRLSFDFGAGDDVLVGFYTSVGLNVRSWSRRDRLLELERSPEHEVPVGQVIELWSGEEAPVVAARLLTGTALANEFPEMELRTATTRGTNALLEGKGTKGLLLVTKGFGDLLRIRDQRRPHLFAARQHVEPPVFDLVMEVRERVGPDGVVVESLDEDDLREQLRQLVTADAIGLRVAAVALLHSYANSEHEHRVAKILGEFGVPEISLSSELAGGERLLPRAETAAANAYLAPVLRGFIGGIGGALGRQRRGLQFLSSAGSLKGEHDFRPVDSLFSGPAGGVRGALAAGQRVGGSRLLTFDMGGTSTDVARLEGEPSYRYEQRVGPVHVLAPAVRIETVAAGGGSICRWRQGGLEVGPESAGAEPGPACYGRGGPLTVTDVNLLLGCMDPNRAGIPLDSSAARRRLEELQTAMRADGAEVPEERSLLEGLREIAVERMADAIRKVSLSEGYDSSSYLLVAFGGAGPQHACAVAAKLGIDDILVPADAGLLSAWGLHRSRRETIAERTVLQPLLEVAWEELLETLMREALLGLEADAAVRRFLVEVRLKGQNATIELEFDLRPSCREIIQSFAERYEQLFGYVAPDGFVLELVAVRVVGSEPIAALEEERFGSWVPAANARVIRQDSFRTCVVEAGWMVREGQRGSLWLRREATSPGDQRGVRVQWSAEVEAELFRSRFESVVREMGELLRRTALSTNVKERLDYSCALLDGKGRLVVNAPHIPVHLGALGLCVREVSREHSWSPGDMMVLNHPGFGGSHLPDITVISPVFVREELVAFVANRAHHAELGGLTPGSMPAMARCLEEEGVVLPPTLVFEKGESRMAAVERLFRSAKYPSRSLPDNLADLAAQVAANRHGVAAIEELVEKVTFPTMARNMDALYERAAAVMKKAIRESQDRDEVRRCHAGDALDDDTPIKVQITLETDRLVVSFEGSGPQHPGNLNATPAVVRSAVLYALRVWVGEDIPLNEGLLDSVEILVPPGILAPSFSLDPAACPAVVGGNIETSQRLVDVLLEALGVQAHSQGTMNNLLFGTERFGYYETVGGGSGAGEGWNGMSGTHVHMSNTSITDAEVLERRFPVRVRDFSLRRGSGGAGAWQGGDGLVREIEFLAPMTVSLLTQRRKRPPRGLEGGRDGLPGRQVLIEVDGRVREVAPIDSFQVQAGQRLRMETPGGGGWGERVGGRSDGGE